MTPIRMLIVEDERIVSFDLRRRLSRMGHAVAGIAASGEEAIAHAQRLHPDVVLMDVRLRGPMDGIEAAQQIWRMVPAGYLSKPFFESQLRLALEQAVETRRRRINRPGSHRPARKGL